MDYSAANHALWNIIVQLGFIAAAILLANFLRQKLAFIRRSLMPIAVLAGKLLALPFDPLFLGMAVCAVIMAFGLIRGKPHVEHAEKETV